jgi:signal transduction histidine kinase
MQTPSLRLRLIFAVMLAWIALVLALDIFVFLSLRSQLLDALDELLDTRAQLALELGTTLEPRELDARLTELGVPAVVIGPDGTRYTAEPASPGFGTGPPAPADRLAGPVAERFVQLDNGVGVTVLATRAGVESTMDQVLLIEAIGSAGVVALMLILLIRASRVLLGPVDQIVDTARRIADGGTNERLEPDRPDTELGRMAVAFDEMLDSLEAAIEESKDAEQEARRSEDRAKQFLADAAHQLRTPIAGLRASVDSLLRTPDPKERDRLLDNLAKETVRASRLVTLLLRVAELDRGEPVAMSTVDLAAIVNDEIDRARMFSPGLLIELDRVSGVVVEVRANADAIAEAIANLLDNSRRHARKQVTVSIRETSSTVEIAVGNDGPALPDELHDRVFDRFASFGDQGGSGLGLPIARSIARAHGGDVTYRGRLFVLSLPKPVGPQAGAPNNSTSHSQSTVSI